MKLRIVHIHVVGEEAEVFLLLESSCPDHLAVDFLESLLNLILRNPKVLNENFKLLVVVFNLVQKSAKNVKHKNAKIEVSEKVEEKTELDVFDNGRVDFHRVREKVTDVVDVGHLRTGKNVEVQLQKNSALHLEHLILVQVNVLTDILERGRSDLLILS